MKALAITLMIMVVPLHLGALTVDNALMPPIYVDNTARYSNGHYSWDLFIKSEEYVLSNIAQVEYTLHPSFPNPVQIVKDRGGRCPFVLSSTSWGEFNVRIKVVFKDGSPPAYLNYWLNLLNNKNSTGCKPPPQQVLRRTTRKRR